MQKAFPIVLLGALLTSGCTTLERLETRLLDRGAPVEQVTLATAMTPMNDQWAPPSQIRRMTADGRPLPSLTVQRGPSGIRVDEGDGCRWRADDWFTPATAWQNCGTSRNWRTAQATVRQEGQLWPLAVGNTARFERRAVSATGRVSTRTRTCRVIDSVGVVTMNNGVVPSFKVRCQDGRRTRTTWWSDEWGPVAFDERTRGRQERWRRAL